MSFEARRRRMEKEDKEEKREKEVFERSAGLEGTDDLY